MVIIQLNRLLCSDFLIFLSDRCQDKPQHTYIRDSQ